MHFINILLKLVIVFITVEYILKRNFYKKFNNLRLLPHKGILMSVSFFIYLITCLIKEHYHFSV
ncbi:hypothetical protein C1147_20780 [Clostridium botulinum]|nr:hypothetical protein C1147_20780 [Clostridium botulinum]RFM20356.1 hypothetical protein C1146_19045 [Clostridium botulinum]